VTNFDKQFINEPVPKSILEDDRFRVDVEIDDTFSGFSFSEEDGFAELEKERAKEKEKEKAKLSSE